MREMHKLYKQKEKHYWYDKVNEGKGCSKKLWQSIHEQVNAGAGRDNISENTADDFAAFFKKKWTTSGLRQRMHHHRTPQTVQPLRLMAFNQ